MTTPQTTADRSAVALELVFHKPGNKKQISNDVIKDSLEAAEADSESLHLSKDMLRSDEYQAVRSHDRAVKKYLRRHCLPSMTRESIYLIPLDLVATTDAFVSQAKVERRELVEKFIEVYPDRVKEAEMRLGPKVFDRKDYPIPEQVRASFWVEARYVSFDTPGTLAKLNQDIFQREQAKVAKDWQEMLLETKKYLRSSMVEFVHRFASSLEPKSDGSKRKVYDSTIDNLNEFLELFQVRNLSSDVELQAMVSKVKKLMHGVSGDAVRDAEGFREKLAAEFQAVSTKLATLVTEAPALRKILKKKVS